MPITPETLAVLRNVANTVITEDLKTEVTVMHRTGDSNPDTNPYGSSKETFVTGDTYLGWLVEISASDLENNARLAGSVGEYELRLPIDAIVNPGDRVVIGSAIYTVQNTNNEETLPIFMEATLRRMQ